MKRLKPKQYAVALYELTKGLSHAEIDGVISKFVRLLAERNQTSLSEKIIHEFQLHSLGQEGAVEGILTTAHRLPEAGKKTIEEKLGQRLKKTVRLQEHIDARVLGGLIVAFPNLLIDASLRTRLQAMKQSMSQ